MRSDSRGSGSASGSDTDTADMQRGVLVPEVVLAVVVPGSGGSWAAGVIWNTASGLW